MQFVENKGQWDSRVKFKTDFPTGSLFLEKKGFKVLLMDEQDVKDFSALRHNHTSTSISQQRINSLTQQGIKSHVYDVDFLGGNENIQIVPEKPLSTYNNYFIGNNKNNWASECKLYQTITYKNVYPNIDVRYYTNSGSLKYDLVVHPGGNPNQILMKYKGVDGLSIKNKELIVKTSVGEVKELYPYTYQTNDGFVKEVDCKYVIEDDVVRFKVKNYTSDQTLVIDPSLIFCSFTGSAGDNWGYTATPGPGGSFFAGGIALENGYPITIGPTNVSGRYDIAIFQFSPNGANRIYATYLGGGGREQPHSLWALADGSLLIAGRSNSDNFPATLTDPAQVGARGGYDIIVTKLNPNGSINASVKLGGSKDDGVNIRDKDIDVTTASATDATLRTYGDDARSEIIVDGGGNIYVASCTKSSNVDGYPLLNAVQTTFGGGRQDGVILKLNSTLSQVLFNTYFGGSGDDACFVLAINPINNNLYVAGGTTSNDLLGDKTGVIGPTYFGGEVDGFITILNANGSSIVKTTYQGTSAIDLVYGIQFDKKGFPYTMGTTTSSAWPILNAPYNVPDGKQFITKLQPNLSSYIYSTAFGTSGRFTPNISPTAMLVDRCENVYVSGWGGILNQKEKFQSTSTAGMPEVTPITGIPAADGSDFFFFVLEKNALSQLFGSHFGQNGGDVNDHVDGGTSRFDANGVIYQGVCANCYEEAPYPTTVGAWRIRNGTGNRGCNQAAIKIEMNFTGVGASIRSTLDGVVDTAGCLPLTLLFTDTLAKGKTYEWNFGDGSATQITTAPTNFQSHRFDRIGTFTVRVISIDPSTCNVSDTAYMKVRVGDNEVKPNFQFSKVGNCTSLDFQFDNITTASDPSKYNNRTFIWDFGDRSPLVWQGFTPPIIHTFPAPGTYRVRLLVDDTNFCNAPVVKDSIIRIAAIVKAAFTTPAVGCRPYNAVFKNTSAGGVTFKWEFGDGDISFDGSPTVTHTYLNAGTYKVRLIANDPNTCNKSDTTNFQTITILDKPTAFANWGVQPPQANTKTFFTNLSSGAVRYLWNFGDGETSTVVNPSHQYNSTGTFSAYLVAYNIANCTDTFPLTVQTLINPLLDVPNAFTPGNFGENGIVKVAGFGIAIMDWKIYNRWGQLVFQTNDRKQGWDGKFKGELQAADVYTYTLDVELSDGRKVRRTGDITLLR